MKIGSIIRAKDLYGIDVEGEIIKELNNTLIVQTSDGKKCMVHKETIDKNHKRIRTDFSFVQSVEAFDVQKTVDDYQALQFYKKVTTENKQEIHTIKIKKISAKETLETFNNDLFNRLQDTTRKRKE